MNMAKKKTEVAVVAETPEQAAGIDAKLSRQLAAVTTEHAAICAAYQELQAKLTAVCNRKEGIENKIAAREVAKLDAEKSDTFTPEQWEYVLYTDFRGNAIRYKLGQQIAYRYNVRFDGYNDKTSQRVPEVVLIRNDPAILENNTKFLKLVLPHLKPSKIEYELQSYGKKEEVEAVYISIFDSGLSEYAKYFALVNESTGVYWAMQQRSHRCTCNAKFHTLTELMEYLNKNHYYETGENDD